MSVNDVTSAGGADANAAASALGASSSADIEQRFIKLLITQLNNQDPLNPMDNAELTSQLAQMSTVSGIEQLNTTLSGLVSQSGSSQVLQAASLIGYNVLSPGNSITTVAPADGEDPKVVPFAVQMDDSAASVQVKITDSAGNVVRTIDAGSMPSGVNAITWDGKDDSGNVVPAGNYQFSVAANNDGSAVATTALTFSQVAAVKQGADGVTLELASGQMIGLADVRMFL